MADERINIDINATDNVTGPSRRAIKALDDIGDKATGSAVKTQALGESLDDVGGADVSAKLRAAEKRIKELGDEATKSAAKVQALESRMNKLNRTGVVGAGKKGFFGAGVKAGFSLGKMFKLILIPAIFDAVGAVATLGSALGAMGAAGVGALGPIVGLLPGALGYVTALGQGFAAVKLGLSGMGDAIKALSNPEASPEELAKALENLGPKSQQLAKQIVKLQEPFKDLKRTVGNQLAPGFIQLTKAARGYIPIMEKALAGTAKVFSGAASSMATTLGGGSTKSMVSSIMGTNTAVMAQLTQALVPMFRTVLRLVEAAGPMMLRFAQDFGLFVQKVEGSVGSREQLVAFYEKTYTVTKGLIKWTADLGMALFNIFKIGAGLGGEMGQSLLQMNENFRRFTESVEGKASIKNWFETMKPIIYEVGYLIWDISKGLAGVSMDKTLLGTLQTLRNDTLPALITMMNAASGKFLPNIAKIIGTLAQIMVEFKAFPTILDIIAKSLEIIARVIQGLPGPVKQLLGYMVTLSSLVKFGGMVGFFKLFGLSAGGAAKKTGMLAAGLSNTKYVMGQVATGAATAGEGVALLGSSAKSAVTKNNLLTKAGWTGLAIGIGLAISAWYDGKQALNAMKQSADDLMATLNKGYNVEGITSMQGQIDTLGKDIASYNDTVNSINPLDDLFDKRVWTDIGEALTSMDPKNYGEEMQKVYDRLVEQQNTYYGAVQHMMDTTGQGSLDYWNEVAQAAGVNASMGVEEMTDVMTRYDVVNRQALPLVRDMANGLKTIGDSAADSASRTDAFTTVLSSMNSILTGGGIRDAEVDVVRGLDSMDAAMKKATVTFRNGNIQFKATRSNNIALHDALLQQATAIQGVASATFESTQDTKQATAAYRSQYKTLVGQLSEGLRITRSEAKLLANQYMATPKQVKTVFSQPGFYEWLTAAPRSYMEVKQKIENNPINVGMKIKSRRWRTDAQRWAAKAADELGQNVVAEQAIGITTPGAQPALDKLTNLQDAVKWFNVNGANVQVNHGQVDSAFTKLDDLRTKALAMKDVEIDIGVRVGTATRAEGDPVFAGSKYLVGERGPEALLTASGVEMIGTHGSEYRTFADDGFVIPNHALPTAEVPVSTSARASAEYLETSSGGGTVYIGTINANTPMDVVREVQRGMEKAQRNSKERK